MRKKSEIVPGCLQWSTLGLCGAAGVCCSCSWSVLRETVSISHLHRPNRVHRTVDAAAGVFSAHRYWPFGSLGSFQHWTTLLLQHLHPPPHALILYYWKGNLFLKSLWVNCWQITPPPSDSVCKLFLSGVLQRSCLPHMLLPLLPSAE